MRSYLLLFFLLLHSICHCQDINWHLTGEDYFPLVASAAPGKLTVIDQDAENMRRIYLTSYRHDRLVSRHLISERWKLDHAKLIDGKGCFYLTARMFDTTMIGQTTILPLAQQLLIKLNKKGEVEWYHNFESNMSEIKIACDDEGNVIYAGWYKENWSCDGVSLVKRERHWPSQPMLAKFSSNGKLLWAKNSDLDENGFPAISLITDNSNNILLTCYMNFYKNHTKPGAFLFKFSPNGDLIWKKKVCRRGVSFVKTIAIGNDNSILMNVRSNYGPLTFENDSVPISLRSEWHSIAYLVKYNTDGQEEWVSINDSIDTFCSSIFVSNDGTIIYAGSTTDSTTRHKYDSFYFAMYNADGTSKGSAKITNYNRLKQTRVKDKGSFFDRKGFCWVHYDFTSAPSIRRIRIKL